MSEKINIKISVRNLLWFLLVFVFITLLSSCSPTKYLKDGEYILKDNKIIVDDKRVDKSEVTNYASQTPNRSILGYPLYISLYNMVDPDKEAKRDIRRAKKLLLKNNKREEKGKKLKRNPFYFSRWWKTTVGEAPVIFASYSLIESKVNMQAYLRNLGFYETQISDSIQYLEKKKKVLVSYHIKAGKPYKIGEYSRDILDPRVDSLVQKMDNSFLSDTSSLFNAYELDDVRYQISNDLQNNGYYGFGPDQVVFFADTNKRTHTTSLELELFNSNNDTNLVSASPYFPVYYFDDISVVNYPYELVFMKTRPMQTEFFGDDNVAFRYFDEFSFKPYLLQRRLDLQSDSIYQQEDVARSIRGISGLGIFKSVHFKMSPSSRYSNDSLVKYLNCEIQLSPATKQSYTIDLEGYTSSGTVGTGLKFTYLHKNLFKRAIYFNMSLNGKFERFTSDINSSSGSLYAYEYGVNTFVKFPKFFSPFRLYKFNNKYFPNTLVNVNYIFKNRVEYVRQTSSLRFGYTWSTPSGIKHNLNPIDFYLTNFENIEYDYLQYLVDKNLYDRYFDHVTPAGNYSVFYTNQKINSHQNFLLFNMNIELAGNLMNLGNKLSNSSKTGSGDLYINIIEAFARKNIVDSLRVEYIENYKDSLNTYAPSYHTFANLLFHQYFKSDVDFRYNWFLNKNISFVARAFAGTIVPYGNTDFSPIEKQYFVGGSNDLRAWWARSLGPGAYVLDDQTLQLKNYYQNGDIKILANFELRHNIVWRLHGALFADMGNIWNIYENPSFPDGQFKLDSFYKQLAIGAGYGLRIDFSFFIVRFDLAFKLHDPSIPSSNKWVYSQGNSYYKTPILNFGIGYPF